MPKKLTIPAIVAIACIALAACSAPQLTVRESCDEYQVTMASIPLKEHQQLRTAVQTLGKVGGRLHASVRQPVENMVEAEASIPDDREFADAIFSDHMALVDTCSRL